MIFSVTHPHTRAHTRAHIHKHTHTRARAYTHTHSPSANPHHTLSFPFTQDFQEWFTSRTKLTPAVRACDFPSDSAGRGLVATQQILPGQPIVSVPWHIVLSVDTALASQYAKVRDLPCVLLHVCCEWPD